MAPEEVAEVLCCSKVAAVDFGQLTCFSIESQSWECFAVTAESPSDSI